MPHHLSWDYAPFELGAHLYPLGLNSFSCCLAASSPTSKLSKLPANLSMLLPALSLSLNNLKIWGSLLLPSNCYEHFLHKEACFRNFDQDATPYFHYSGSVLLSASGFSN